MIQSILPKEWQYSASAPSVHSTLHVNLLARPLHYHVLGAESAAYRHRACLLAQLLVAIDIRYIYVYVSISLQIACCLCGLLESHAMLELFTCLGTQLLKDQLLGRGAVSDSACWCIELIMFLAE